METITRMFKHLYWANRRLLEALKQEDAASPQALRLYSHLLYAERVWVTRLKGEDSSHLPIWGEHASLDECGDLVKQNEEEYTLFFEKIEKSNVGLDDVISYKNSRGESFQLSVRDILTHVALHGQYHRGQINASLRQSNVEPASLDYYIFVRE